MSLGGMIRTSAWLTGRSIVRPSASTSYLYARTGGLPASSCAIQLLPRTRRVKKNSTERWAKSTPYSNHCWNACCGLRFAEGMAERAYALRARRTRLADASDRGRIRRSNTVAPLREICSERSIVWFRLGMRFRLRCCRAAFYEHRHRAADERLAQAPGRGLC